MITSDGKSFYNDSRRASYRQQRCEFHVEEMIIGITYLTVMHIPET